MFQDICSFQLPKGFRGRSAFIVQLWWFVDKFFFKNSPQVCYQFRVYLLRLFGARIGVDVKIRPSVTVTYPWKLTIGDYSWIGDGVVLYSLGEIFIGSHSVVSQKSYICAGNHDYAQPSFPIRGPKIFIGNQVWVATDVYVAPGVTIGDGAVIGARSSVFKDMPAGMICFGSPCVAKRKRVVEK